MGRTRRSAKNAGAWFERLVADYLARHVDDRIDRRVKTGAKDCGDIAALRHHTGQRIVIECKEYGGRLQPAVWLGEAEVERKNDAALAGIVVAKRLGKGQPQDQHVLMTLADLVALLTGTRPVDTPEPITTTTTTPEETE